MSTPEHKQQIWELIHNIGVGMLVTKAEDSADLHARPMQLVQDAYDGTLYFYTNRSASKVFEVEQDREVCLTFADHDAQVYVSLTGNAKLNDDPALIDRYWNEWVAAWFPKGKNDPEVTILEVKVNKGEHWDTTESKMVQLFKLAKAKVLNEQPSIGDHASFGK